MDVAGKEINKLRGAIDTDTDHRRSQQSYPTMTESFTAR